MKKNIYKIIALCLMLICLASCGEEEVITHIHEWSEWEVKVEPTCVKEGLKSRHCLGCEKTDDVKLKYLMSKN